MTFNLDLPRFGGHSLCRARHEAQLSVVLVGRQVIQTRVRPLSVVPHFDELEQICHRFLTVCQSASSISSHSTIAKKLYATALYQQFPRRLMLATMPCEASAWRYSLHAYCTPWSE
jgi:hypothetical protein